MKTIFETFKKSIYNPSFYKEAESIRFVDILKYYTKAALILSVFLVLVLGMFIVPVGVKFVKERAPYLVKEYYPKELTVNIDKGVATANVPMPYFVSLKAFSIATTTGDVQNMLVINTMEEFDKTKFDEYRTYSLLTKTELVTRDEKGAITIQPLGKALTTTVSQDVLLSLVTTFQNSLWWIVMIVLVVMLVLVFFGYIMYLIPLAVFALIPKLIAYLQATPLSYVSAYKMSLYAIIPALALKTLLNAMGILFLPSYFTLLVFMLIIAVNMREVKSPTLFENNN